MNHEMQVIYIKLNFTLIMILHAKYNLIAIIIHQINIINHILTNEVTMIQRSKMICQRSCVEGPGHKPGLV